MDREAAVIRAEMSQTRAQLDHKIARLEERAREMSPRRYWERHKPDFLLDRTIGGILTMIGLRMALTQYRDRYARRARVREALASYGRW
jgi:hypothetical protein